MGTKTETKNVSYCDLCKSEGTFFTNCLVCEREFCHMCAASPREGAYFNRGDLCKECAEKPMVQEVQEAFRACYWDMQKKEKEWFARLKEKVKS